MSHAKIPKRKLPKPKVVKPKKITSKAKPRPRSKTMHKGKSGKY